MKFAKTPLMHIKSPYFIELGITRQGSNQARSVEVRGVEVNRWSRWAESGRSLPQRAIQGGKLEADIQTTPNSGVAPQRRKPAQSPFRMWPGRRPRRCSMNVP